MMIRRSNTEKKELKRCSLDTIHDHVIKWKHFPRYWPFVRVMHWSPVNSPHIEAGDLRRHRADYDVTVL